MWLLQIPGSVRPLSDVVRPVKDVVRPLSDVVRPVGEVVRRNIVRTRHLVYVISLVTVQCSRTQLTTVNCGQSLSSTVERS